MVQGLVGFGEDFDFYPSEVGAVEGSEQRRKDPTSCLGHSECSLHSGHAVFMSYNYLCVSELSF